MSEAKPGGVDSMEQVIAVYKRDLDLTLLCENLKLTPEQRLRNLQQLQRFAEELRRAGRAAGHDRL